MIHVSTPSRICLFGEHQDYLGLEVIASAINLHFTAHAQPRSDSILHIRIRDKSIGELGAQNTEGKYEEYFIDTATDLVYENNRDYFKSVVNVLRKAGFSVGGADVTLDSEIPIGKGMCSSTTMVLVLTTALAALSDRKRAEDAANMALLAWKAEVEEFHEPGGMMDHYASALGGLVHLDFSTGSAVPTPLDFEPKGCFILFDSLQDKDTIKVLGDSKYPTQEALASLNPYGITSIRDFYRDPSLEKYVDTLDEFHQRKVRANIDNYRIQREALQLIQTKTMTDEKLGELLNRHQANLRDGLQISTPVIDRILETAIAHGAFGGKFNGSGGGGCLYCYAPLDRADSIVSAVNQMGYPAMILRKDRGLTITD
ncbi:MAG: galactokinase family protein [Candidatus Merdivicinus sp.]|jgi:galactokinase